MRLRIILYTAVFFAPLLLAACGSGGRLRYESPKEAFDQGLERFEKGKYERAAEYFQGAFDFGRTHEYAADAQFFLARSYRNNKEYLLAANEYTRFMQIYRSDARVPDAEYERAMTYYERSPEYELDQTDTERAVEHFQLFIKRYSNHPSVTDAEGKIAELREKMAHKQYETAKLYERRELHEAAAVSFEAAFDRFPDTDWADDALVGAMRAYINFADRSIAQRQRQRLEPALEHYQRLLQLFPESPLLKEAESLYEKAQERLARLDEGAS